ncbi:MAG TPA: hypothetical protein VN969_38545 [Streptosporangiaceae bacterium]|jgi:hypothetical protein|nr:hypothetical protein [Streptosporangiaceae bacterium]
MSLDDGKAADEEEQLDARLADLLRQMRERHYDLHEAAQSTAP